MKFSFLLFVLPCHASANDSAKLHPDYQKSGSLFAVEKDVRPAASSDAIPDANISAASELHSTAWPQIRKFKPNPSQGRKYKEVPPLAQRLMELAQLRGQLKLPETDGGTPGDTSSYRADGGASVRRRRRRLQAVSPIIDLNKLASLLDILSMGANTISAPFTATTTRSPYQEIAVGLQSFILGAQDITKGLQRFAGSIINTTTYLNTTAPAAGDQDDYNKRNVSAGQR